MGKQTRMNGIRLGFTYAAGIVVLACLIAMITAPSAARPRKDAPPVARPAETLFDFTAAGAKPRVQPATPRRRQA